nr:hypothetical protein [Pandoravirus aubagnensis]
MTFFTNHNYVFFLFLCAILLHFAFFKITLSLLAREREREREIPQRVDVVALQYSFLFSLTYFFWIFLMCFFPDQLHLFFVRLRHVRPFAFAHWPFSSKVIRSFLFLRIQPTPPFLLPLLLLRFLLGVCASRLCILPNARLLLN